LSARRDAPRPSALETAPEVTLDALPRPTERELVVVVGPTASGKTALALRLAERWGAEIVSADSVQIVRGFDAGSGKPTRAERARAPHHLLDAVEPDEPIDAARFAELAERAIAEVRARGRVPIVAGGTFLWVKALTHGLAPMPPADPAVRARHAELVEREGPTALHARLAEVDPEAARRLAPNDVVRVSRALEVFEQGGVTQSELHARHGFGAPRHDARFVTPARARGEVEEALRERVRAFLAAGWVDEVRGLVARGHRDARAMKSVGYREVLAHVEGELAAEWLEEAIVRATRVFVRRQRTWLRDLELVRVS
jgi:tRNA dimethylallyltransferase